MEGNMSEDQVPKRDELLADEMSEYFSSIEDSFKKELKATDRQSTLGSTFLSACAPSSRRRCFAARAEDHRPHLAPASGWHGAPVSALEAWEGREAQPYTIPENAREHRQCLSTRMPLI
jgi:hypothetical protein